VCVYVTFNNERSQRQCLRDCATGLIEEWTGEIGRGTKDCCAEGWSEGLLKQSHSSISATHITNNLLLIASLLAPPLLIAGCSNNKGQIDGHVLKIDEPVEPSEVIYENLHLHWIWQYWGIFKAYCLTAAILGVSFVILSSLSVSVTDETEAVSAEGSSYTAAIVVSLINGALPYTLKVITLKMEVHKDEVRGAGAKRLLEL